MGYGPQRVLGSSTAIVALVAVYVLPHTHNARRLMVDDIHANNGWQSSTYMNAAHVAYASGLILLHAQIAVINLFGPRTTLSHSVQEAQTRSTISSRCVISAIRQSVMVLGNNTFRAEQCIQAAAKCQCSPAWDRLTRPENSKDSTVMSKTVESRVIP